MTRTQRAERTAQRLELKAFRAATMSYDAYFYRAAAERIRAGLKPRSSNREIAKRINAEIEPLRKFHAFSPALSIRENLDNLVANLNALGAELEVERAAHAETRRQLERMREALQRVMAECDIHGMGCASSHGLPCNCARREAEAALEDR